MRCSLDTFNIRELFSSIHNLKMLSRKMSVIYGFMDMDTPAIINHMVVIDIHSNQFDHTNDYAHHSS